jgi:hypothetical protein
MNSSTPIFPIEARPNRAARRFVLSSRRRRKGQALILAVLVMLMVAVLSAGFLVVVSGNLNHTARVTDKTRAIESARSGLKFVNQQLTYSQLGEKWHPGFIPVNYNALTLAEQARLGVGESVIPTQTNNGDATYGIYYSSVDIANGWAGKFAKFPDPLAPRSDAPQYLARVQRVVIPGANPNGTDPDLTDPTDPDSQDPNKIGMLKITVIGLSNDDPAAFSKVVAYKGGQQSSPIGRFARVVTNWDFKNKTVPAGQVGAFTAAAGANPAQLALTNVHGAFPTSVPFTVMIGNANSTGTLRTAVVQGIGGTESNPILVLAADPSTAPQTGERVEVAAQLGASTPVGSAATVTQSGIDFDNDPSTPASNTKLKVSEPTPANAPAQSGSVFVNGSVAFAGDLVLSDLVPQDNSQPYYSSVRASGLMLSNNTSLSQYGSSTANQLVATSDTSSSLLGTTVADKDADPLVADGFNRLNNDPSSYRQTKPFSPPDIASGAGAARYRQLTRDSPSTIATPPNQPSPSNYGYGEGIYINNPSDREKIFAANLGRLRDMTQAELVQMWLSRQPDGVTDDRTQFFNRLGKTPPVLTPTDPPVRPLTATDASLEEQHVRGWVGPDEFHARGALIELINEPRNPALPFNVLSNPYVPKIAITLDSHSDNTSGITGNANGPVDAKAWKDVATGNPVPGVYRRVFNWPANGVIFAEGNVRVRGELDYNLGRAVTSSIAPRSLTIVSENNIYIDGPLDPAKNRPTTPGSPNPKILLLARKNVVTNPTALVSRVDVASKLSRNIDPAAPTIVPITDNGDFQAGDWVSFDGAPANTAPRRVVQVGPDPTGGTILTLDAAAPVVPILPAGSVVRSIVDPLAQQGIVNTSWGKVSNFNQVIQRRLPAPALDYNNGNAAFPFRLAFSHSAEARPALSITIPPNTTAKGLLTGKEAGANAQVFVNASTKELAIEQDQGTDRFSLTDNSTLNDFVAAANSKQPTGNYNPQWNYQFSVLPTPANPVGNDYGRIAPTFLAAVGNRRPFGFTATANVPDAYPWKQDLKTSAPAAKQTVVATSVTPTFGGFDNMGMLAPTALGTDFSGANFQSVSAFGFAADPNATNEDVLTADKSFYVPDAAANTPQTFALDSRVVSFPTGTRGSQTFGLAFSRVGGVPPTGFEADPVTYPLRENRMPYYRLGALKLEDVQTDPMTQAFAGIRPVNVNINAYVYAQTGSWFVIPAPLFDTTAKNNQDADRNGQVDGSDAVNSYRFARYNYRINFFGAIAENQTAIVNSAGTTVTGAVQQWSNSWANVTTDATAVALDAGNNPIQNAGVVYTFDPTYVTNNLGPNDTGFVMPQNEQLTYVE